jgi:hypothetical protein
LPEDAAISVLRFAARWVLGSSAFASAEEISRMDWRLWHFPKKKEQGHACLAPSLLQEKVPYSGKSCLLNEPSVSITPRPPWRSTGIFVR